MNKYRVWRRALETNLLWCCCHKGPTLGSPPPLQTPPPHSVGSCRIPPGKKLRVNASHATKTCIEKIYVLSSGPQPPPPQSPSSKTPGLGAEWGIVAWAALLRSPPPPCCRGATLPRWGKPLVPSGRGVRAPSGAWTSPAVNRRENESCVLQVYR